MRHIYIFHYPGQFVILYYYFSNKNTEFWKGEHIPRLHFCRCTDKQICLMLKKKKKITFPDFLKAHVLVFVTILRKQ